MRKKIDTSWEASTKPNKKFIKHLERASAVVKTWPEWKQKILGGPSTPPVTAEAMTTKTKKIKRAKSIELTPLICDTLIRAYVMCQCPGVVSVKRGKRTMDRHVIAQRMLMLLTAHGIEPNMVKK